MTAIPPIRLGEVARERWERFLSAGENRGHAERTLAAADLGAHVGLCFASAREAAARLRDELACSRIDSVLDIGCSTGFTSFALQEAFPGARVIGVEPELAALEVAQAMAQEWPEPAPEFRRGVGEELPIEDEAVDLVVCHTVLEHVYDVERVIGEMARVLSPRGIASVEAPNYLWPAEPHLRIWCLPLLGKPLLKACAVLQGKGSQTAFLDHLQLVHPRWLERSFRDHGLVWENRVAGKLRAIARGTPGTAKRYGAAERLLRVADRLGLTDAVADAAGALGLYPSVLYTLRRRAPN